MIFLFTTILVIPINLFALLSPIKPEIPIPLEITKPVTAESVETTNHDNLKSFIEDKSEEGYTHIKDTFTDDFVEHLLKECKQREVDPWLVVSIMEAESSFNPESQAYDDSDHYGLMQISSYYFAEYFEEYGTNDFYDKYANLSVGVRIIAETMEQIKDYRCVKNAVSTNPLETLAVLSYHNGVTKATELYKEERIDTYTKKVIRKWLEYKELYGDVTPYAAPLY